MLILSSFNFDSNSGWANHPAFDQHHFNEFEEVAYVFAILALSVIGVRASQLRAPWQPVYSTFPAQQLPPPK
jgi:hypothetical protein